MKGIFAVNLCARLCALSISVLAEARVCSAGSFHTDSYTRLTPITPEGIRAL